MKMIIGVIAVILIVIAGGVTLVKNSDTASAPAKTPASTAKKPATKASTNPSATTTSVEISGFAFSPSTITVTKGATVTWTNKDSIGHTVTETDGQDGPKSGDLNQGQSYSFTFNTVGTFKYNCSIHPNMTGTVIVTEAL